MGSPGHSRELRVRQLKHQVSSTNARGMAGAGCLLVRAWWDYEVKNRENQLNLGTLSFLQLRYPCHQGRWVLHPWYT